MALQQMRLVHFLMLGVVAVSLFIYASYSLMNLTPGSEISALNRESVSIISRVQICSDDENTSVASLRDFLSGLKAALPDSVPLLFQSNISQFNQSNGVDVALNVTTSLIVKPVPVDITKGNSTSIGNGSSLDLVGPGFKARSIYESGHSEASPRICSKQGSLIKLLILIMSAPLNKDARTAIRQTWGHFSSRRDVAIGFILGTTQDSLLEESLMAESYMYQDIIRGHFLDSYNNLTLKTISMLEWTTLYCSNAKYVLKTDDDMFINVPKLLSFIDKHIHDNRVIFGRLAKKWKPIRNTKSKYYVAPQQFMPAVFPDFTTGPAYLISSDLISELYSTALDCTYLKLEDVFTTGIVGHAIGAKLINIREFLNKRISLNPCNVQKAISIHMIKTSEQFDLWKKLLDGRSKCK